MADDDILQQLGQGVTGVLPQQRAVGEPIVAAGLGMGRYLTQDLPLQMLVEGEKARRFDPSFNPAPFVEAGTMAMGRPPIAGALGSGMAAPRAARPAGRSAEFFTGRYPEAKFSQYAEEYPPVGPPAQYDPKTGKEFGKTFPPETEAFKKERERINKQMKKEGFIPYFDPAKRYHVDPRKYKEQPTTLENVVPGPRTKQETLDKLAALDAPETRKALREAYEKGLTLGDTGNWYAMGQLESELTRMLGAKKGREAFRENFAMAMAATTGGSMPQPNLLMAMYGNYLRTRGLPFPTAGHQMPAPIGGRFAMGNIEQYQKFSEAGGIGLENPKRQNFMLNFLGFRKPVTVDEVMSMGMAPQLGAMPPGKSYGLYERVIGEEAKKAGVMPSEFQGVAWHGYGDKPGKPMITVVNEAIERTHQLTGMPREEIVRRAFGTGDIPLYAGSPTMGVPLQEGSRDAR